MCYSGGFLLLEIKETEKITILKDDYDEYSKTNLCEAV